MTNNRTFSVLLEMRPALDGHAGIPQETRLLFRGLCECPSIEVEGLLQTSLAFLAPGAADEPAREPDMTLAAVRERTRVVVSMDKPRPKGIWATVRTYVRSRRTAYALALSALLRPARAHVRLTRFAPRGFEEFVWRRLFEKTLPADDFKIVTARDLRVCTVPWNVLQSAGLLTLKFRREAIYPRIALDRAGVFIAQTPYPGRIPDDVAFVVRYHDAFPIMMPDTIANKVRHQATHMHALVSNAKSGAYFACVSETTRQGLIALLPEVRDRSVTIHNMISADFRETNAPAERVKQIVRLRITPVGPLNPTFSTTESRERFYADALDRQPFKYLLMVSTIEPRKNHARLLAAWSTLVADRDPSIKLVFVGNAGWGSEVLTQEMRAWIDTGALFVLSGVPAEDLCTLYRHAVATVCPSLAEGFDYSGLESMASGGVVVSSDIAVHREVYGDATEYFDPHCTRSLADAIGRVAYDDGAELRRSELKALGRQMAPRYRPKHILPQWERFLGAISAGKAGIGR